MIKGAEAGFYIGKYGETLHFTKIGDGYLFSASALGIWDQKVDEMQKNALIDTYCVKGVPDFAVSDRIKILDRASALGKALYELYMKYQATNDEETLQTMREILANAQALKLNDEDYIDCFLTFGEKEDRTYCRSFGAIMVGQPFFTVFFILSPFFLHSIINVIRILG